MLRVNAMVVFCVAGTTLAPLISRAENSFLTPYAAEEIEHDSNIFDLSKSGPTPVGGNGPTFADTFYETRAGATGAYLLDQDRLFGTAEFRHFNYDNFTELNHNENLVDGGLKWKSGQVVDGLLEYKHEERMVLFQDLEAATQLILEKENTGTASVNVNATPDWRIESLASDHVLDSPRVDVPGLSVHEDSITEGLKYLGVSDLSAGLQAQYLKGKYEHDALALDPDYHQITVGLAATYLVSGFTNFTGTLGYSHRTDPTNNGLSGVTGSLLYRHSLSAKTSVNVQLTRAINTYLTTGGNEIDTSAAVSLNYQLTYKINLKAGYSYTNSSFPGTPDGAVTIDRVDHFQIANVEATYQFLHWLSVRVYAKYQSRHSNDDIFAFSGNMVGVELLAKPPQPNVPNTP